MSLLLGIGWGGGRQRLLFMGQELADASPLRDHPGLLTNHSVLHMTVRPPAGERLPPLPDSAAEGETFPPAPVPGLGLDLPAVLAAMHRIAALAAPHLALHHLPPPSDQAQLDLTRPGDNATDDAAAAAHPQPHNHHHHPSCPHHPSHSHSLDRHFAAPHLDAAAAAQPDAPPDSQSTTPPPAAPPAGAADLRAGSGGGPLLEPGALMEVSPRWRPRRSV